MLKNQWFLNDFSGFWEASWDRTSIQNLLKINVNFGRHLGIDFWWISVDFGNPVGRESRSKIHKLNKMRLEGVLAASWGLAGLAAER